MRERSNRGPTEDNDPELISRSFYLIDLISPGPGTGRPVNDLGRSQSASEKK